VEQLFREYPMTNKAGNIFVILPDWLNFARN